MRFVDEVKQVTLSHAEVTVDHLSDHVHKAVRHTDVLRGELAKVIEYFDECFIQKGDTKGLGGFGDVIVETEAQPG